MCACFCVSSICYNLETTTKCCKCCQFINTILQTTQHTINKMASFQLKFAHVHNDDSYIFLKWFSSFSSSPGKMSSKQQRTKRPDDWLIKMSKSLFEREPKKRKLPFQLFFSLTKSVQCEYWWNANVKRNGKCICNNSHECCYVTILPVRFDLHFHVEMYHNILTHKTNTEEKLWRKSPNLYISIHLLFIRFISIVKHIKHYVI